MATIGFSRDQDQRLVQPVRRGETLPRALLVGGILSAVLYAAITALVPMRWDGYSSASRTISELSAIGAPTRRLWALLCIPYTLLAIGFGWGVWRSAGRDRPLRVVGGSLLAFGALGLLWPFAPMHLREVLAAGGATSSDTTHIVLGSVSVVLMLLAIGFGAAAFGRSFRLFSIASFAILLVFGVLTFLDAPGVAANRPTPWIGAWERINVGVFLLWEVVLAIALLRIRGVAADAPRRGSAS